MRAIILAAGMGTRLRPLTLTKPKSLIEVHGQSLIERQIMFLRERGIDEIIVVTGYLAEQFEFLTEKYNIKLIYNDKFDIYNNFYSMYLVKDYLQDTYVIDADNYLVNNFFKTNLTESTYFSVYRTDFSNEWEIKSNECGYVKDIVIKDGSGYILSGVSYWSNKDGRLLQRAIEKSFQNEDFTNLYWDNIVLNQLSYLSIYQEKLTSEDIFEIDSLEDLNLLESFLKN